MVLRTWNDRWYWGARIWVDLWNLFLSFYCQLAQSSIRLCDFRIWSHKPPEESHKETFFRSRNKLKDSLDRSYVVKLDNRHHLKLFMGSTLSKWILIFNHSFILTIILELSKYVMLSRTSKRREYHQVLVFFDLGLVSGQHWNIPKYLMAIELFQVLFYMKNHFLVK
jgi:hypothetical protein